MAQHKTIEEHSLPDEIREDLCRSLLAEFGATSVHTRRDDHELNVKCVLPWHPERSASASLNWKKLTYRCQGCDSKGGLYWLIGMCRGESATQSRKWLASQTGRGPDGYSLDRLVEILDSLYGPKHSEVRVIPQMSMKVLTPWYAIHPYLTEIRHVPVENIKRLRIGYGEFDIRVDEDESGKGVFVKSERIVIPHIWRGNLVGWQTRRIMRDGTPKYQSSADFPRDRTIYNHDPKRRLAVMVESPASVMRHCHHQPMEGWFGAAITDMQIRIAASHPRLVLWPDPGKAGDESMLGHDELWPSGQVKEHSPGAIERLTPYSDVYVVDSPWAADPADMDDDTVDELIDAAVPAAVWQPCTELLCWLCKQHHEGECEGKAA